MLLRMKRRNNPLQRDRVAPVQVSPVWQCDQMQLFHTNWAQLLFPNDGLLCLLLLKNCSYLNKTEHFSPGTSAAISCWVYLWWSIIGCFEKVFRLERPVRVERAWGRTDFTQVALRPSRTYEVRLPKNIEKKISCKFLKLSGSYLAK